MERVEAEAALRAAVGDRLDRLPAWARDKMITLQQSYMEAEREKASLFESRETRVEVDQVRYGLDLPRLFLPDDSVVKFTKEPGDRFQGGISAKLVKAPFTMNKDAGTWLQVHGDGTLSVVPSAANSIYIRSY